MELKGGTVLNVMRLWEVATSFNAWHIRRSCRRLQKALCDYTRSHFTQVFAAVAECNSSLFLIAVTAIPMNALATIICLTLHRLSLLPFSLAQQSFPLFVIRNAIAWCLLWLVRKILEVQFILRLLPITYLKPVFNVIQNFSR